MNFVSFLTSTILKLPNSAVFTDLASQHTQPQSFTEYLRQFLVFMRNNTLQEFPEVFAHIDKISFWGKDWALDCNLMKF